MVEIIPEPIKFDWDAGNNDKSFKKHEIRNEETEEVFLNVPAVLLDDEKYSKKEKRYMLLGRSDRGKLLSIVFTVRGKKIRIISARAMCRKERGLYEKKAKIASNATQAHS